MRIKNREAKVLLVAAAAASMAFAAACSSGGGETPERGEPVAITVAIGGSSAFFWLHQIALDEGFFAEEDLDVETVAVSGAPNIVRAVQSGSADFGVTSTDSVITADLEDADIKIIGMSVATPVFTMMSEPEITEFEDLQGRALGTSQLEQNTGLFIAGMLDGAGLTPDDVNLVVIGATSERVSALRSGAIEAAPVLQPQDFQLEDEGYRILATSTEYVTDVNYISNFASERFLEENPETTQAYVNAMVKAATFFADPANKDAVVESLINLNEAPEEYAVKTYDTYADEDVVVIPPDFAPTIEGMEGMAELMLAQDRFSDGKIPDVEQFLDLSFVENALQG